MKTIVVLLVTLGFYSAQASPIECKNDLKDVASFHDPNIGAFVFDIPHEWISDEEIQRVYNSIEPWTSNFDIRQLVIAETGENLGGAVRDDVILRAKALQKKGIIVARSNRKGLPIEIARLLTKATDYLNKTLPPTDKGKLIPFQILLKKADVEKGEPIRPIYRHFDRQNPVSITITLEGDKDAGTVVYINDELIFTQPRQGVAVSTWGEHAAPTTYSKRMTLSVSYAYELDPELIY